MGPLASIRGHFNILGIHMNVNILFTIHGFTEYYSNFMSMYTKGCF